MASEVRKMDVSKVLPLLPLASKHKHNNDDDDVDDSGRKAIDDEDDDDDALLLANATTIVIIITGEISRVSPRSHSYKWIQQNKNSNNNN